MTYILGIHIGHDSSAALVQDGTIVADVSEERFVRVKHYAGLPFESIRFCLRYAGIEETDVDVIAFSKSSAPRGADLLFPNIDFRRRDVRGILKEAVLPIVNGGAPRSGLPVYLTPFQTSKNVEVDFVEHHKAHAASAYYTCGRPVAEKVTVATLDGVGDGVSCAIWRGQNGCLNPLFKVNTTGSLGWFYSNVTEALGWWHGDGEGTTMGLAPYGDPSKANGVFDGFYPRFENGQLMESIDFGPLESLEIAGARHHHLPGAVTLRNLLSRHQPEDLAAEAQSVLERQVMNLVLPWMEREGTDALACAGGVFLNVKLNQRIWYSGHVKHQHIFPNAGDSGLAVGAALAAYHSRYPEAPVAAPFLAIDGRGPASRPSPRAARIFSASSPLFSSPLPMKLGIECRWFGPGEMGVNGPVFNLLERLHFALTFEAMEVQCSTAGRSWPTSRAVPCPKSSGETG